MICSASEPAFRVLVACTGDWHTEATLEALEKDGLSTLFLTQMGNPLAQRSWRHVTTVALALPVPLRLAVRVAGQLQDFSASRAQYWRMVWFDKQVSKYIADGDFNRCILWAGMAARSLEAAAKAQVPAVLFLGSTPYFYAKERRESGERVQEVRAWTGDQRQEFEIAPCIWAESRFIANSVRSLGVPDQRILSLTPPLAGHRPEPIEKPEVGPGPLRCATVQGGRRKGTDLLFNIWPNLAGQVRLDIFGSLERSFGVDLPAGILHRGHLMPEMYHAELARCEVALFPTYGDGGPRSLFEAMAAGLCPIASANCAAPELIDDGESGFIVPAGDAHALASRIRWCLENRDIVRRMGGRARAAINQRLDPEIFRQRFREEFFT